jgi:ParB family transcriptional regulator, chromosome partitioning protein
VTGLVVIPTITSAPIAEIEVTDRLRPVAEPTVAALDFVIGEFGFTVPILVRKMKAGFRLIDGAHRLEVMKRRGDATIPVVAVTCTDEEARVLEGSQNLAGAAMSPLDEAIFVAAFSDAYQRLHPETKRGMAGALAKHGLASELSSFAEVIGEKRSISPRQVQVIARAGRMITKEEAAQLRASPLKLTLKDIQDFGKIGAAVERQAVALRLSAGNAKSVADARRSLRAESGAAAVPPEPSVEAQFKALSTLWSRSGAAARRRFVGDQRDELLALLDGGADE